MRHGVFPALYAAKPPGASSRLINAVVFDHALGRLNCAVRERIPGLLDFVPDLHTLERPGPQGKPEPAD